MQDPPDTLTPREAARRLGIGVDHLRRLVREGKVTPEASSAGGQRRYTVAQIETLLEGRK